MSKKATLLFIIILIVSTLIVESTFAQVNSKPSIPEFSLKVVEYSYDVAPTITVDPYTGENVTTQMGYHVENKSIQVTIKNQPFIPYIDDNDNNVNLYYNISVKGHFEDIWDYCFNNPYRGLLNASNSEYTIISMPIGGHSLVPLGGYPLEGVDSGDQVDFQVQAQIGYYHKNYTGMYAPVPGGDFFYVFTGETSGWSKTQTIIISTSTSPIPSPNPTPSPSPLPVPGQSFFFVESNSIVSELFFNSTNSELSFVVSGESKTAGYVKVTIAKSLVSNLQNVKVYLDGNQLEATITSDVNTWFLNFNYVHSVHNVKICLASNDATNTFVDLENWIRISIATIIAVIGAGLLIYFKKHNIE